MIAEAAAEDFAALGVLDGFPEAAGEVVDAAFLALGLGHLEDVLLDGIGAGVLLLDALEAGGQAVFVWRCGSPYRVSDPAQLELLKQVGLARQPVLTVAGPLVEPAPQDRPLCGGPEGTVCPKRGWGVGNPFAPAGCRPE